MQGRSSSLVGYGIGIAEVVGSNPTRSKSFAYLTNIFLGRYIGKIYDRAYANFSPEFLFIIHICLLINLGVSFCFKIFTSVLELVNILNICSIVPVSEIRILVVRGSAMSALHSSSAIFSNMYHPKSFIVTETTTNYFYNNIHY